MSEWNSFFRFQSVCELCEAANPHSSFTHGVVLFLLKKAEGLFRGLKKRTHPKKKYRSGMIKKDSLKKK